MSFSSSKVRIFAAVLLLTPLFFYWSFHQEEGFISAQGTRVSSGIDYFMKDTQAKEYDAQGNLERYFSVKELQHLTEKGLSELTEPSITLVSDEGEELSTNSRSGTLYDDENRIDLAEQVVVSHNLSLPNQSTLETEQLTLLRDQKIAKTDAPVTIRYKQQVTTATGMVINYATQTTDLLSEVKGTYHVKK